MKIGEAIVLVVLFALLGTSVYLLYLNWPGEPVKLIEKNGNQIQNNVPQNVQDNGTYAESEQFYPNLRFPDSKISYGFATDCDQEKITQMEKAFEIIESRTVIDFYHVNDNPEIFVACSEIAPEPEQEGHFIAGEGGPTKVINTSLYAVAFTGKISLYKPERCDEPHISVHELLHVLGFDHNEDPMSILYPTLDCKQKLDDYFIERLNELYSVQSEPDLKISDINATKSGRYLSFEIGVVNQGLVSAEGIDLDIIVDGKEVKKFDLGSIDVGTTKILSVENLKISRSAEEIRFVVDKNNKIPEIYEDNNDKTLVLSG